MTSRSRDEHHTAYVTSQHGRRGLLLSLTRHDRLCACESYEQAVLCSITDACKVFRMISRHTYPRKEKKKEKKMYEDKGRQRE